MQPDAGAAVVAEALLDISSAVPVGVAQCDNRAWLAPVPDRDEEIAVGSCDQVTSGTQIVRYHQGAEAVR